MPLRYFIVPAATTSANPDYAGKRFPKYLDQYPTVNGHRAWDYGSEPCFLLQADFGVNTGTVQGMPDVVTLPALLDNTIGANLVAAQTSLEAFNIPADWLVTGMTWRQVLRGLLLVFRIAQRYNGFDGVSERLLNTDTLDTVFNTLPQAKRTKLIATAQSLGFNTSGLAGTMTIRQILYALAQQVSGSFYQNEGTAFVDFF